MPRRSNEGEEEEVEEEEEEEEEKVKAVGESREIACFFSFSLSSSLTSGTLRTLARRGRGPSR